MNNIIQREKIINKLSLLESHICDLIEYNNLKNYDNVKQFTIKLEYYKKSSSYNYNISILRGTNKPEKTLSLRFNSLEKINDLLDNMIKNITANKHFSHTSFGKNSDDYNRYIIYFKNNVSIEFDINDEFDKQFYNDINNKYKKKVIVTNDNNSHLNLEMKNELQKTKAIKILNNIDNIFSNLIKLNDIENYENKKPYKLIIKNEYNNGCYLYNFVIVRGNMNPENIIEYSLSIFNNEIVLEALSVLINKYIDCENFLYKSMNCDYNRINYNINLKNDITLEIHNKIEKDNIFYDNIFNTSQKTKKLIYNEE